MDALFALANEAPFLPFVKMIENKAGIMSCLRGFKPIVSEAAHKSQAGHPQQVA